MQLTRQIDSRVAFKAKLLYKGAHRIALGKRVHFPHNVIPKRAFTLRNAAYFSSLLIQRQRFSVFDVVGHLLQRFNFANLWKS